MAKQPLKFRIVPTDYGRKWPQVIKTIGVTINVALIITVVFTVLYTRHMRDSMENHIEEIRDSMENHMEELKYELTTTPTEAVIKKMLDRKTSYLTPRDRIRLAKFIATESEARGLDIKTVIALIDHESRFDPHARSHKGALGLMQVMPKTGKWVADWLGLGWNGESTLLEPFSNTLIGLEYLSYLRKRLDGSMDLALVAYERGPAYAMNLGDRGLTPYARTILAAADDFPTSFLD